ncbi:MAG TPA: hypothetical protein QF564_21415 [Pirellulaceae bacterium]|nr:hypothetical protein [Pirellulaceae bacterium]
MDAIILVGSLGDAWLSARTLGLMLWGGLAVLTLALLIVTRTRWGHAQPLSKCVVLSVFAHVLFMGYAYGTKLIFDAGNQTREEVMQLAVIAADRETQFTQAPADALQPWDRLASEAASPAEIEAPERLLTSFQEPTTAITVTKPNFESSPEPQDIETSEPERPLPAAAPVEMSPLMPAEISKVEIDSTSDEPSVVATPNTRPEPTGPELPRAVVDQSPTSNDSTDSPRHDEVGPDGQQIQRLVDVPIEADSAQTARGAFDQMEATDNAAGSQNNAVPISVIQERTPAPLVEATVMPAPVVAGPARRRPGDGLPVPKLYQMRNPENRLRMAQQFGGNEHSEGAVDDALSWLASAQSADGRWDANQFDGGTESQTLGHDRQAAGTDADTGITGLALLAFLAAGHTHLEGAYRENVQHGLEFLLRSQADNGNLYGDARLFARMYCHGIAALALGEAYVMTGDHRLMPFLAQATRYTRNSQHPSLGGWRYQPGDQGDMSQFGWQVMALRSTELAGIEIPSETRDGMLRFLRRARTGPHGGLAAYRAGERPSRTMTAEAMACRYFLRLTPTQASVDEATDLIHRELPGAGRVNLYYWYYATLTLFHGQDPDWERWNEALQDQLLSSQRRHGQLGGSWDPDTVWGGYGGRVYSTAMAALCLEVYYRYLPLFDEAAKP